MINLKIAFVTAIEPVPPFNFDGTVHIPHHFLTPDSEWITRKYWQTMNYQDELIGIKMMDRGTTNQPRIKITIYSEKKLGSEKLGNILNELNWRFRFNENISEFYEKFRNDKFLRPVFKKWKGMRFNCANSLYELLIISIALQNASIGRTVQMMSNLFETYGKKLKFGNKELFAYWKPEDLNEITEDELRILKVGYRAKMIKKMSEAFSKREINEYALREMPTENAKEQLMKLYGVGPATAQIILGEYLRKYDAFDLKGRLWEQKILSRIMFNRKSVPLERITKTFDERYGNWKELAFHYIFTNVFWRHKENKIDWLEKEIRI